MTLFDYCPGAILSYDHDVPGAIDAVLEQIDDHYSARLETKEQASFGAPPYNPVPKDSAFFSLQAWQEKCAQLQQIVLSPFDTIDGGLEVLRIPIRVSLGANSRPERVQEIFLCLKPYGIILKIASGGAKEPSYPHGPKGRFQA